jgi:hypothetical protein
MSVAYIIDCAEKKERGRRQNAARTKPKGPDQSGPFGLDSPKGAQRSDAGLRESEEAMRLRDYVRYPMAEAKGLCLASTSPRGCPRFSFIDRHITKPKFRIGLSDKEPVQSQNLAEKGSL